MMGSEVLVTFYQYVKCCHVASPLPIHFMNNGYFARFALGGDLSCLSHDVVIPFSTSTRPADTQTSATCGVVYICVLPCLVYIHVLVQKNRPPIRNMSIPPWKVLSREYIV